MDLNKKIKKFKELKETISAFNVAESLLSWDMSTGASKKGMDYRGKMIGIFTIKSLEVLIGDEMKSCLDVLGSNLNELDVVTKRMYVLTQKEYDKNMKTPKEEIKAYAELQAKSQQVWEEAKEAKDYSMFKGVLGEIIEYQKKFVKYRGLGGHPYNTCLDDYEEGMTVEMLDEYFENLKKEIVPLVKEITSVKLENDLSFLEKEYPIEKQKEFCLELMNDIGYDLDAGMVKESVHPFSMGLNVNDVRLTIAYLENNLISSVFSAAHEAGHAIYEQNISEEYEFTGLDTGTSSGIHESQSRTYENLICRSKSFWKKYYPKLVSYFPTQLENISLEDFYIGINKVENSLIRIEADELTYSLHVIIRYEIEKAIMEDQVTIDELPNLWNEKVKEYLNLEVPNDELGILQDVHWSFGLFGYFPTYSIGSAYASQFFNYLKKDIDFDQEIEKGNYKLVNDWLKEHIHQHGLLKTPEELLIAATGKRFDSKYYLEYLTNKYKSIYNL